MYKGNVVASKTRQRIAYGDWWEQEIDTLAIVDELESIVLEGQGSKSRASRLPTAMC